MKSIDDALELRARIFGAFELAELSSDPKEVERLLTFVVVGAGPTGVEMAGQIRELASKTLPKEFRNIDTAQARVILVEGGPDPLPTFGEKLGDVTRRDLGELGVEFMANTKVVDVDEEGVTVQHADGSTKEIPTYCKVWAAGVAGHPIAKVIAEKSGARLDRAGRIKVEKDLSLAGEPNVFVIGDMMALPGVPGVAQAAIQGARFVTNRLKAQLAGKDPGPDTFTYFDKGSMATIARSKAVVSVGKMQFHGFPAWLAWSFLHILYITGFKSRVSTLFHWVVSFMSYARSERTTTNQQLVARLAIDKLGSNVSSLLLEGVEAEEVLVRAMDLEQRRYEAGLDAVDPLVR